MQELIKIKNDENGNQIVSARELHDFLEVQTKFNDWFNARVKKYKFEENQDFVTLTEKKVTAQGNVSEYKDYAITIDMAKELSMVENNNKGSQARKYFIKCEKAFKENVQALNTSELSPELQMFGNLYKAIANQELEQKKLKADIEDNKKALQGIRDIVALTPNAWRKDTASLISKIAMKLGGFEHIKNVREESYKILNETYRVNIKQRLLNKQRNMALEGCTKSKINKLTYLDVIADDEKLINGYLSIVSKMAIKYGIDMEG